MPVLEAMTLGVPVVAANRGALPEVLGDAGLLVDPDDPDDIAAAIARAARRRRRSRPPCAGEGRRARAAVQLARRRRDDVYDVYRRAIAHRAASGAA